jgi:mannose-6-phosphate isomerase-like protein (cupin superfamily)
MAVGGRFQWRATAGAHAVRWTHNPCVVIRAPSEVPVTPFVPPVEAYTNEPVRYPPLVVIDIAAEGAAVTDDYRNQVLSQVNRSCLRLGVLSGAYPWHRHPHSDELFLIVDGLLEIDLADGRTLKLGPWQSVVVPAGMVHRTRGVGRTVNLCFEDLAADTMFVERVT